LCWFGLQIDRQTAESADRIGSITGRFAMLGWLAARTRAENGDDDGFTLIELLVVIIIIGILAAIAIPVFLQQRKKGYDAAIKSDLVAAATAEETYLTDFNVYAGTTANLSTSESFKFSAAGDYSGTPAITIAATSNHGYCLTAIAASGNTWFYDSSKGGLQPLATTYTCSVT
jgi:type IV pilus assembly protein PilA